MARPRLSDPLESMMIEELPEGRGLETPLTKRKRRARRPSTPTMSSDGAIGTGEESCDAGPSSLDLGSSGGDLGTEASDGEIDLTPLPIMFVDCDVSVPSTPRSSRPSTSPSVRRKLTSRGPGKLKCGMLFDQGSEEEDESDEELLGTYFVPRICQWGQDEDEDQDQGTQAQAFVNLSWPPVPVASIQLMSSPPPEEEEKKNEEAKKKNEEAIAPDTAPTKPTTSPSYSPSDKFAFEWRKFSNPQIEPELRREKFSNINCGPTAPSYKSPYDVFTDIWDSSIMEHIVRETNAYAQQLVENMMKANTLRPESRITRWVDTTVDELYAFFAIMLALGTVVKTRVEEYWAKAPNLDCTPEFSSVMSHSRYLLLSRCLHFNDNRRCNTKTKAQAKLFKVQPVIDHLNSKFSALYVLDRNIALDESLTMWKGFLNINQFMKNKAAGIGIKTYEVCESKTGYLWRFEVHPGEDLPTEASPVSGAIPSVVLRLLRGLEGRGHTVWMDNYYNSPALARELKSIGFDCVGTLRTNRQFVPEEFASFTKANMAVGEVCGCTSGDVDLVLWRDKNRVALVSTYHGLATVKCGDALRPTIIADYNICMGGVDRKDQMLSLYPVERKRTHVWYKKFFRRLVNVSILNAYILYKHTHPAVSHRTFRRTLVEELLMKHKPRNHFDSVVARDIAPANSFLHYPTLSEPTASGIRQRGTCKECRKRITAFCAECDVALCTYTCFMPYHKKLQQRQQKITSL